MANFFESVGGFFSDAWDTVCGVGKTVADTVVDAGKTAVNFTVNFPKHVTSAFTDGVNRVMDGVDQMKSGAGFAGFVNCVGGAIHATSPMGWFVDAANDTALENTELVTDALGNSTYQANENASSGLVSSLLRGAVNTDRRGQESIRDALEEGDSGAANMAMLSQVGTTGTQVLSSAAMAAGVACQFVPGVGTGVGIALGVASQGLSMAGSYMEDGIKAADLESDIDKAVKKDVDRLTASGALSEENKDAYIEYLTKFYNTTSVNGLGQTGAMSKEDFELLAAGNGLLNMNTGGTDVSAYPDDMAGSGTYDIYADYYDQMVRDGSLSADQADRLSTLGAMYDEGQLDEETYLTNMHLIQYENYDLTEDQAMTLAVMDAYVDMGEITQEEHAQLLRTESVFDNLVQPDGTVYIMMTDEAVDRMQQAQNGLQGGSLESAISSAGYDILNAGRQAVSNAGYDSPSSGRQSVADDYPSFS